MAAFSVYLLNVWVFVHRIAQMGGPRDILLMGFLFFRQLVTCNLIGERETCSAVLRKEEALSVVGECVITMSASLMLKPKCSL